ncbi:unnamed protein product, partial [Coregonus sp. 'balchen']
HVSDVGQGEVREELHPDELKAPGPAMFGTESSFFLHASMFIPDLSCDAIFEWWYFRKYGTSFIEQVSVSHLRPLLGGVDNSSPTNSNTSNGDADSNRQSVSVMQKAWRERNPQARISAAHEALELEDCATAYILLAEEEATTIVEAEKLFKQALMKEFPLLSMFNIHENLLESLLELQNYADVQAVLAKYDDISLPKSATICYTAALLKARAVSDKMIPYPLEKGHLFYPYPICTETADRELLPMFHEVSVYPKKELPFFILFTAGLCSFTAMLALLTHQFPELMGVFAKAFLSTLFAPLNFIMEKVESILPSSLWHQLTRI